jgi:ferrous iron transport protein A
MTLDDLPFRTPATVTEVQWATLPERDARRLRDLGLDEGVRIESLHGGWIGRDPLAVKIGRMTVAIRRANARAVLVEAAAA